MVALGRGCLRFSVLLFEIDGTAIDPVRGVARIGRGFAYVPLFGGLPLRIVPPSIGCGIDPIAFLDSLTVEELPPFDRIPIGRRTRR